jgi:hypothetical protein
VSVTNIKQLRSFLGGAIALRIQEGEAGGALIGDGYLTPELVRRIDERSLLHLCVDVYALRPRALKSSDAFSNIRLFPRAASQDGAVTEVGFGFVVEINGTIQVFEDNGDEIDLTSFKRFLEQQAINDGALKHIWQKHVKYLETVESSRALE